MANEENRWWHVLCTNRTENHRLDVLESQTQSTNMKKINGNEEKKKRKENDDRVQAMDRPPRFKSKVKWKTEKQFNFSNRLLVHEKSGHLNCTLLYSHHK